MAGRQPSHMHQLERAEGVTRNTSSFEPSSLFPPLLFKPHPMPPQTAQREYELTLLKLELENIKKSMFYIPAEETEPRMERYTDKYQTPRRPPLVLHWPDFPQELWPKELQPTKGKKRKRSVAGSMRKTKSDDIWNKLEQSEKLNDEEEEDDVKKVKKEEGDEENSEVEEDPEESFDDEGDYNQDYYNNNSDDEQGGDDDDAEACY